MAIIFPTIPYTSQFDTDASQFRNDCGTACLAMILNAFGTDATTNAVFRRSGADAEDYVSVSQLMRAGESYGVPFRYFYGWNVKRLMQAVNEGQTMICLVHYGGWSEIDPGISTQSSFTGPHFVVTAGYDGENIYVNDPLWRESRRMEGFRKVWSYRGFNAAWGSNYKDGQRDYSGIICDLTLPTANWDPQTEEQEPIYQLDPAMSRRIKAWAFYHNIPEPEITGPAVANAYIEAMGVWGERTAEHEVGETDTLGLLALRYYDNLLKYQTITLFNGLTATDTIHDEDMLTIPEPLERPVEIPDEERPIGGSTPHQDRIRLLNELKIEADRIPRLDYERR